MKKIIFIILLLLLYVADLAEATTYYVDASCATPGDGTSQTCSGAGTDPWDDLSDIAGLSAGDFVLLKKGEIWKEKLTVGIAGAAGNPITYGAYGTGVNPIITARAEISGWDTGGNWTEHFGIELVTDGGFTAIEVTGSELIVNGNMESNSDWDAYNAPNTQEQSAEQVHGGSSSWKVVHDGSASGILSAAPLSTTTGKVYQYNYWVYPSGTVDGFQLRHGDGAWLWSGTSNSGLSAGSWNEINLYHLESAGGTACEIGLVSKFAGTWYFDDVSYKEVIFSNWTAGTGWVVGTDSKALTDKADKTAGTGSNLEQTGTTATASTLYQITYTVTNRTAGAVYVEFGSTNGTSRTTNATFVQEITTSDTDHLKFVADASFDGTIDTVSVKQQGNIWSIDSVTAVPYRVWLSDVEYLEDDTDTSNMDATTRWYYDGGFIDILYVYSPQNPADEYSAIEASNNGLNNAVYINSKSNLTFQNLQLEGGAWTFEADAISADCDNIIIENCTIGKDGGQKGIWIQVSDDAYSADNGIIRNSTISSEIALTYTYLQNLSDGIRLMQGVNYWLIHDNTISDFTHNLINIGNTDADRTTNYNEIYSNYMTLNSNLTFCRAITFEGQALAKTSYNKVYRNYIYNLKARIQILGDYNEFYYNIIDTVVYTPVTGAPLDAGQGLSLEDYSDEICQYNKVNNNIFYNTDEVGVRIWENGIGGASVIGNEVINNIFINNGNDSYNNLYDDVAFAIEDTGGIGGNTIKNNLMYKSGVTDLISYRGTLRTIAEFNGENGNNSDVMADNIGGDPLFVSIGSDFTLQSNSPCIDTGIDVGLILDYLGNTVPWGVEVDIGAYELQYALTGPIFEEGGTWTVPNWIEDIFERGGNWLFIEGYIF